VHLNIEIVKGDVENKIATIIAWLIYQYGTLIVAIGATMNLAFLLP
jgi:hypothetical protein